MTFCAYSDNFFFSFFPLGILVLKFLTRFFAVIGFLFVLLIGAGIALAWRAEEKAAPEPDSVILTLNFTQPIVEQSEPSPFTLATGGDEPVALLDVLEAIDAAKDDPHVKGIVARFGDAQPTLTQAQEIRAALARFRTSGKFAYAYGTDFGAFGMGNRAYFLASAFDQIWLQPVGTVSLTGVSLLSPFAKTALDKIGVSADYMQREEYKSFMEPGQRDGFSPPVKAEMQAMAEDLADQIASGIAESRKWEKTRVKDLMDRGPYTDEEALQEGLVTRLAYVDELQTELESKAGKDAQQTDVATYLSYADTKPEPQKSPTVALIYGSGLITDKNPGGGGLMEDKIMGADDIAEAFDDAAKDDSVKAVLFRVDSPGGSPAASETIRRALIHAKKQGKPVIVSMGETAASGGYWISMDADKIIADPATLTGSIGVLAGKFEAGQFMQKLGVSVDGVSTAPNAGMWMPVAPFTPMQRARVNALLDSTYHAFLTDASAARKIPMAKMQEIAKGRVWTGQQAVKIGLVDALGGYEVALDETRKLLKLDEDASLSLEIFPPLPTPAQRLMKFMRHLGVEASALTLTSASLADLRSALSPWIGSLTIAPAPVAVRMGTIVR